MTESGHPEQPHTWKGLRKLRNDWALLVFVPSLALLTFFYGFAAAQFHLPPSRLLGRAVSAFKAINLFEDETLSTSANSVEPHRRAGLEIRTLDTAAGKDNLLVTGGPFQDAADCPKFGCLAWIMDRSGKIMHAWPLPLEALFNGVKGFTGKVKLLNFYPIGIGMLKDGSIVATFHVRNAYPYVVGIARISWDGQVLWKHIDGAHHWLSIGPDERIYAPIQLQRPLQTIGGNAVRLRCPHAVYDEGVRTYRADGSVESTFFLADLLIRNGYPGLIYSLRDDCDPVHLNSVDVVTPQIAAKITGAEPGDLLISAREMSAVMLIDPVAGKIKRIVSGRTAAQHSAHFLPDGTVLVFDNLGGELARGGSRIMRLNLVDGSSKLVFPAAGNSTLTPFFSSDGGTVASSPDGKRAMISSKDGSRDIEIDTETGKPLWTMVHNFDVAPFEGGGKPSAALFKAYGTYYLTDAKLCTLPLFPKPPQCQ